MSDDLVERAAKRIWELRMKRWEATDHSETMPMLTWEDERNEFKDDLREDVRAVLDEASRQLGFRLGELITVDGVPGHWLVGRTEGTKIKLHPCDKEGTLNAFNDTAGEFWIETSPVASKPFHSLSRNEDTDAVRPAKEAR